MVMTAQFGWHMRGCSPSALSTGSGMFKHRATKRAATARTAEESSCPCTGADVIPRKRAHPRVWRPQTTSMHLGGALSLPLWHAAVASRCARREQGQGGERTAAAFSLRHHTAGRVAGRGNRRCCACGDDAPLGRLPPCARTPRIPSPSAAVGNSGHGFQLGLDKFAHIWALTPLFNLKLRLISPISRVFKTACRFLNARRAARRG